MTNTVLQAYRLSPQQARLQALGDAAPELPLGVACALGLRGALDPGALGEALVRVAARHEILRTSVRSGAEGAVQVVEDFLPAELELRDLAGLSAREREEAEAAAWAQAVAPRPGADEASPLHAVLLRRAADDHVLHLALSALFADAGTLDALVVEIGAAYAGLSGGGTDGADGDEPFQYVDFSEWLHETVASDDSGEGRSFWARQPREDHAALPELWPRSAQDDASGTGVEQRDLDAALARRLEEASAADGMEAWLLAAWRVVLRRHLGDEGFAVGVAADGRTFDELRGSLGPFTRYVPLRGDVDGAASFESLAAATGDGLRQARAWQAFHAWPAANGHGLPRLRFGFDWAEGAEGGRWGGVEWRMERRWHQTERFGARLSGERTDGALRLTLAYDAAALPAEGASRLLRRLTALLEAAVAEPSMRADMLPLLDAEERSEALGTTRLAAFPADEPLHRRFERQAARTPHAVAVTFGEERLTYGELDARANRLGRHLRTRGVGPESRVGLCVERGMEAVVGILGILKAGGAYVPMDPAYPQERLAYVLEDAGIRVLLTQEGIRDRIPPTAAEVVCIDAEWGRIAEEAEGALSDAAGPDSLAYVIYTSGSTGRPKGVEVTHAHVARLFAATDASFGFGADDVWTLFHSLAFDFSVWELWGALLYGGRLVIVPFLISRSPADFRALLAAEGVTVLNQTPSAFRQLIAADEGADSALALRYVVFGGEALEPAALRPWMDRHGAEMPRLVNMYGITETTVHVTHRPLTREDAARGGRSPVGAPIADLAVYLLDGGMHPVAPGLAGEMFVGGAGVARGYLGRPALTAERFVPDPFAGEPGARMYRSGDRARRLSGGELEFLGRADEQVKVRGFRIEPGEIEAALRAHPSLADAAVVAREDGPGEKRLVGYVVPAQGAEIVHADLRAHLLRTLPEYMVPAAFAVLPRLPLTTNGKLDRRALPAPAAEDAADAPYAAPRTPTEEVLAAVWAEVLGRERVGIDDNFFAVGGDSLLSVRIAARAREQGVALEIADLFAHPTVRALAERVAEGSGDAAALDAILRRDRRPFDLVAEADRARMPEDAEDAYPLASLQAGMLYHQALTPDAPAYHNVDSFQFRGPFDEAAFRTALRRATARQENLRTSIHLAGFSEPLQVVHRHAEVALRVDDVRHLDDAAQEALLARVQDREWHTPFDVTRAPLLRLHVHLRADDRFHLTLAENHAINDGWSLTSLFAELFEDQAALLRGDPLPERPLPAVRFRDFIELERATMASGESRRFWAECLAGWVPGRLPRPAGGSGEGGQGTARVPVPLSAEVREGLARLARAEGVPLKSVLLAAHLKVMSLSTGERDVVTGLATNGRPEVAGGTDVRGLLTNTLPLRLRMRPGSWRALVRDTFHAEAELLPHRRYPLALLQREHGPERLFETSFILVRFHSMAEVLRNGTVEILSGGDLADTSHTLSVAARLHPVTGEIMLFGFNYQRGVISAEQAAALGERYRRVLEAMVAEPEAPHDAFPVLDADERARMLDGWNRTERPYPRGVCIHERFQAQVRARPDGEALVWEDVRLSYAELDARANRLAHHLRRHGVGPDARVGVLLERGVEMIVSLLAILKAGGCYVPLDPGYPAERLALMLADCDARVLVTRTELAGVAAGAELPVVALDAAADAIAAEPADAPRTGATPRNLAYIVYTSGSTGRPKGVMVEHRHVIQLVCETDYVRLGPGDRVAQASNASFDALAFEAWGALLNGATLVGIPREVLLAPAAFREALRREGITTLYQTTALLNQLSREQPDIFAPLREVLFGGQQSDPESVRRVLRGGRPQRLLHMYGPTETTAWCSWEAVDDVAEGARTVSVGLPTGNQRIYLLDGALQPTPAGVPGEAFVGGDGVVRGYLDRPALTAERFVPDPFAAEPGARMYRTGDRLRWKEVRECVSAEVRESHEDGSHEGASAQALTHSRTHALEFIGRLDAQVKIRGFRIEPGEIESVLSAHPQVEEARVVVREDAPGEPRLVAYVVGGGDADGLRAHLRRTLPEYMVPAAFVALDRLPLTPVGKLDVRALPAPELEDEVYVAPRTPAEEAVAAIWAEVLGRERVGVHDGFFELGGHSLLAMRIGSRVREAFGVEVPLRSLFERPTVAGLAEAVEALLRHADDAPPVDDAEREDAVRAAVDGMTEAELDRLLATFSAAEAQ